MHHVKQQLAHRRNAAQSPLAKRLIGADHDLKREAPAARCALGGGVREVERNHVGCPRMRQEPPVDAGYLAGGHHGYVHLRQAHALVERHELHQALDRGSGHSHNALIGEDAYRRSGHAAKHSGRWAARPCRLPKAAHRLDWRAPFGYAWGSVAPGAPFRVVGIDPGLHITGYAVLEFARLEPRILEAGCIRTPNNASMGQRVAQLQADIAEALVQWRPDLAAIEQLYAHYKHPRTAILMGHARGVILLACQQAGVAVKDVAATMVKKSLCGNGHASKLQVQKATQAVCQLAVLPRPPDVADAIAIALCAGRHACARSLIR